MENRICEHCGSDTYFAQNYEKLLGKVSSIEMLYRQQAASHARERADWQLRELEWQQSKQSEQSKVQRQRKVINRLEQKLRDRGQVPYRNEAN